MPRVKKLDLGMTALDELFMNDKERAENKLPKIFDIPLSEIDDFPDHPYRVLDDEDMQNLMESIRDRGVITPAMVRKKDDGRYEMISGHRRKHASERLGLETLRCEVVEVSRDEAIILMVDSNAQRSEILPCDKGRAYKMKLDAIKRLPGRPSKENADPVGPHLSGTRSNEELAEEVGDSTTQIKRYIRLTYLVPELQEFVDKSQMKIYYRENSRMNPVEVSVTAENRIKGMIGIRDCVRTLIEYQTEDFPDSYIENAVKTANDPNNPTEVASMDNSKYEVLKNIFWDMHVVSSNKDSKTEKIIIETRDDSGNIIETESTVTKTYLYITVTHKTPDAMAAQYGFTDEQKAWLAELLSKDNKKLWNSILY